MHLSQEEKIACKDALSWAVPTLLGGQKRNVLIFVAQYFGDDARHKFERAMGVNDPIRIEAEQLLCDVLHSNPNVARRQWQRESRLKRHTNWGKTLVGHLAGNPNSYENLNLKMHLDKDLVAGLMGLAVLWAEELRVCKQDDRYALRVNALEHASRIFGGLPDLRKLDRFAINRLRNCHAGAKLSMTLSLLHGSIRAPWSETDSKYFLELLDEELDSIGQAEQKNLAAAPFFDKSASMNVNTALEVLATLAIAKVFNDEGWTVAPSDMWSPRRALSLTKDGYTAVIRKGFPNDIRDSTVPYLKAVGHTARGKQPDIVICLSHSNSTKKSYFIGDAKRNIEYSENYAYCRNAFFAILADLVAYSHVLKINLATDHGFLPDGWNGKAAKGLLFFTAMRPRDFQSTGEIISGFDFTAYGKIFQPKDSQILTPDAQQFFIATIRSIISSGKNEIHEDVLK